MSRAPILIAGPTGSGKSALALRLAECTGGWVVNADALQVYDCWRILTARPTEADLRRAPHRLYGHVRALDTYSVGHWLREMAGVLSDAHVAGARPIIVGGTGLYFGALTRGLAEIPAIPPDVAEAARRHIANGDLSILVERLSRDDPETLIGLDIYNPRRIQRAWEVLEATGIGLADWQSRTAPPLVDASINITLSAEISILNKRLDDRFNAMLRAGALDECRRYRDAGLLLDLPAGRALGASDLMDHLDGRHSLEAATNRACIATHRYAKRQRTWFRNQMPDWHAIDPTDPGAVSFILAQSASKVARSRADQRTSMR